jgi:hypothetical protein
MNVRAVMKCDSAIRHDDGEVVYLKALPDGIKTHGEITLIIPNSMIFGKFVPEKDYFIQISEAAIKSEQLEDE